MTEFKMFKVGDQVRANCPSRPEHGMIGKIILVDPEPEFFTENGRELRKDFNPYVVKFNGYSLPNEKTKDQGYKGNPCFLPRHLEMYDTFDIDKRLLWNKNKRVQCPLTDKSRKKTYVTVKCLNCEHFLMVVDDKSIACDKAGVGCGEQI